MRGIPAHFRTQVFPMNGTRPDRPKILIVDDLRANLVALDRLLDGMDAEVIKADCANSGLALLLDHDFALALIDVNMPGMDGYEMVELLRGEERTRSLPVIFLTAAYADEGHRLRGYRVGAVDYIEKPIEPLILHTKVKVFLDLYKQRRQLEQAFHTLAAQNQRLDEEVHEHQKAERALSEGEARYRAIFTNTAVAIFLVDGSGHVMQANEAWLRLLGYGDHGALGAPFGPGLHFDLLHPEDRGQGLAAWRRLVAGEIDRYRLEVRLPRYDGSVVWGDLTMSAIRDSNQVLRASIGIIQDITDRKAAEDAMRASEERMRLALSGTQDGVWDYDLVSGVAYYSPRWKEIIGFRDDQLGHDFNEWMRRIHPDDLDKTLADFDEHLAGNNPVYENSHRLLHRDGAYRWVMDRGRVVLNAEGRPARLVGATTDITELRREQARQQELRERLELILRTAGDGIFGVDESDRVIFANTAVERLTGFPVAELIGQRSHDLLHHSRNDGSPYPLDDCPIYQACRSGQTRTADDEVFWRRDGGSFPVEYTVAGLRSGERVTGAVVVFRDISDRRMYEASLVQARAAAEAASQAKSSFLAMMSHELRTPMTGVIGMADFMLDTALTVEQASYLATLRSSAETLMVVLNDVLDFSKIEAGALELEEIDFDPCEVAAEVVRLFEPTASGRGVVLRLEGPAPGTFALRGDPIRLRQILFNLVGNAVKFTERGAIVVRLDLGEASVEGAMIPLHFEIEDTGIGLTADQQARLFSPFTQADAAITRRFGGTGLGLAICKRLVVLMGGRIGVTSHWGQGSRFWFELALRRGRPVVRAAYRPLRSGTCSLWVLVAEDNPVNQRLVRLGLERMGHRVDTVENGLVAVARAQAHPYDAIIMDLQMPELGGEEATRRIRALPGTVGRVPVIALTADAIPEHRSRYLASGLTELLIKPIEWKRLGGILNQIGRDRVAAGVVETIKSPLPPLFDPVKLAHMERSLGEEGMAEMLAMLPDTLHAELAALKRSAVAADLVALRRAAHSVKGVAANFALTRLHGVVCGIENCADNVVIGPLIEQVEVVIIETLAGIGRPALRKVD
ncbi:two-component system, sensor histidine kinase [uncultured Gammaproteobacteria bacterium]